MSLINQVLLDLDRRHAEDESVPLSARSVRQAPRKNRLALGIVAAFVAMGAGAGAAVVVASTSTSGGDKTSVSQGVVVPKPVVATGGGAAVGFVSSRGAEPNSKSTAVDPLADAGGRVDAIGGNPFGGGQPRGNTVRVASNSDDDVQLLAMSPAMPGMVQNSDRATLQSDGADDIVTPPVRMPRLWDASPPSPKASRATNAQAGSWSDETNVASPDTRVASLSPAARRGAASTAQSVIDAQDPEATIRKARSLVKPSVVRTEVRPGSASAAAVDSALTPAATVALAPAVVTPMPARRGARGAVAPVAPVADASVEKRAAPLAAADRADAEYQKALALHLQGQTAEARLLFVNALREDRRHAGARQALAVGLVGDGKLDDAQALLTEGLDLNPRELQLSATLARIKAQRQDLAGAIATLTAALATGPSTAQKSELADARALLATLQQKSGAHADAIDNYSQALRQVPGNGTWWIGLGISLAASGRAESARAAFERARATDSLSPDLDRYVEQRLATAAAMPSR